MVPIEFRAERLRNEPAPGQRNSCDGWRIYSQAFFPTIEVNRAGIRAEHDELREGNVGTFRGCGGRVEGFRTIARQTENERTQYVNTVASESPQTFDQVLAREIEILVNIFQPSWREPDRTSEDFPTP